MDLRGLSVGLSVTIVSPAKTAKSIEMPFGLWSRVGSWNHADGDPDPQVKGTEGNGSAHCKVKGHSAVSCAKNG